MSDGDSWQLSAELKPKPPAPAPVAADNPLDPVPPAWQDAADNLRTTVKWMVTAFAAVGAVMFAKGFVTTPKLSWADDRWQLLAAWAAGGLALLALGTLIYEAVRLLRPALYELNDLPQKYIDEIDANPRFYLPSDARNLADYHTKLRALRRHAAASARDLIVSEQALADARVAEPKDEAAIAAAVDELKRATARNRAAQQALGVYATVRRNLLDRAGYWAPNKGLNNGAAIMAVAGVVAAFGGIGYQLLLAAPDDGDGSAGGPAAPPAIGELVRSDTAAGEELWRQLRLAECQADPASPRLAVVVASGAGTDADPYVVSTLPSETCRAATFSVVDDVARVSVPERAPIAYEPAAADQSP